MAIKGFDFYYGDFPALIDINLDIYRHEVLALMGPSGCGKSTLLRRLNRINDTVPEVRRTGSVLGDEQSIHDPHIDLPELRKRFGWVAQKPNPFPSSIYENIAYGPRIHGLTGRNEDMEEHVHTCLQRTGLWNEVKDQLRQGSGQPISPAASSSACASHSARTSSCWAS